MGKKTKTGKGRLDKFYQLAKDQGFRARSAYKLVQLNRKYDFLSSARSLVDLLQVAAKYMPVNSLIIGVDLVPIKPIRNVITLQEDITTARCRTALKKELKGYQADVVLNDGAPNVGAQWNKDAYTQAELTLAATHLAADMLREGGTFVTKVFRSGDYNSLLWVFQQLFRSVEATKPQASRSVSAEIFVVCRGFKAPASVDPRLFNPKHVFEQVDEPVSSAGLLLQLDRQKRHRSGYEDGNYTQHKTVSAHEFVEAADPIGLLVTRAEITFADDEDRVLAEHGLTNGEVKHFCSDLKLLSKGDFRKLLRWRHQMRSVLELRKSKGPRAGTDAAATVTEIELDGEQDASDGERAEASTHRARSEAERARKLEKKKKQKQRERAQKRLALHSDRASDIALSGLEGNLFDLGSIKTSRMLDAVPTDHSLDDPHAAKLAARAAAGDFDDDSSSDSDADKSRQRARRGGADGRDVVDSGDDEDDAEYNRAMEEQLDAMYEQYMARRVKKAQAREAERLREELQARESEVLQTADVTGDPLGDESAQSADDAASGASDAEEANPLLRGDAAARKASISTRAAMWFDNPLFSKVNEESDEEEIAVMAENARRARKRATAPNAAAASSSSVSVGASSSGASSKALAAASPAKRTAVAAAEGAGRRAARNDVSEGEGEGGSDSDEGERTADQQTDASSDDEVTGAEKVDDTEQRARTLALATMLMDKRKMNEAIDESFNRYAFNDEDLPEWFVSDQRKFNRKLIDVEPQLVQQYRDRFQDVDARTTKKIMEAKYRKKKRLLSRLERAKAQAGRISEQDDMNEAAKARAIEKLYRRATHEKRKKTVLVVGTKSGAHATGKVGRGTRRKNVDPRMKKEVRAQKRIDKRAGRKTGGGRPRK